LREGLFAIALTCINAMDTAAHTLRLPVEEATMRIYVLFAHPDPQSFNGRLADAYCDAAVAAGHEIRRDNLFELNFDPILRAGLKRVQPLENDLIAAQANLSWCERFVLIYPVWWGNVPALLKGFFDRTLYSEFTYRHDVKDPRWSKLLEGKSGHIITTSDAPAAWLRSEYRDADIHAVRNATLQICGMKPVQVTRIGGVKDLSPVKRQNWLTRVAAMV
jgi:NAD(P)H dehydrogenase (quinone)